MRLVMMGTGVFAEPTFESLLAAFPGQVVGLVTQPDRDGGNKRGSTRQTGKGMATIAEAAGVPVARPVSINTPDGLAELRAFDADLAVVAAYGQILKPDVIAAPRQGMVNVHASLLPKYRGAAPVAYAIWKGETRTGVTIICITPGLDSGDMLAQEALDIGPDETTGELEARLAVVGAKLAADVVRRLHAGPVAGEKQDPALVTKAPKITKEMGLIDWTKPAEEICRQVRAMQPWPTAYTFLHRPGKEPLRVIVSKADTHFGTQPSEHFVPGELYSYTDGTHQYLAVHGGVRVLELQPAGKRKMTAEEFLRGYPVQDIGERFGPERAAMTAARRLAADILHEARARKAFASELLDQALTPFSRPSETGARPPAPTPAAAPPASAPVSDGRLNGLSGVDRRFLHQLVLGVTRRRATLDALVTPFVTRPAHAVEDRLWDVLHLGAYQLAFLNGVPPHAAVHESVELAAHVGRPGAKGFINGVLRRVAELITPDTVDYAYADTLPIEAGRYRKLSKPVLPNPDEDEAGYLSAGYSWPKWLAERWLDRHGFHECQRLGFWFNQPPPLWVRVNKRRTDREAYRLQLAAATIPADPGPHPQALYLPDPVPVRELPGYAAGEFSVQDLASMAVASAVNPQPGMRILDLCAAPGGKTTHLAELMDNRGRIVACDIEPKRLDTVTALCQRLGVTVVEPVLLADGADAPAGPFDAALVDVPCSNTGVLGRRPEVRWRLRPHEFEHLIRLQTRLLLAAVERVKPGGHVVYSTCSIEPDENQGVVAAVRRAFPKLTLEADAVAIPGRPADGGYWARLRLPG